MDLLTFLFRLPLMPLRGFIRLGEIIRDEAERELHDPAAVRHQLEEAERERASGQISDADVRRVEGQAIRRLAGGAGEAPAGAMVHDRRAERHG